MPQCFCRTDVLLDVIEAVELSHVADDFLICVCVVTAEDVSMSGVQRTRSRGGGSVSEWRRRVPCPRNRRGRSWSCVSRYKYFYSKSKTAFVFFQTLLTIVDIGHMARDRGWSESSVQTRPIWLVNTRDVPDVRHHFWRRKAVLI